MAQLAIKGHPTRGREVIQLLEMLGGVNYFDLIGTETDSFYYIRKDNNKIHLCSCTSVENVSVENVIFYTLEEFLEKFPYKVGDKVTLDNKLCSIIWMCWECNNIYYQVQGIDTMFTKKVIANDLQPYKEETNMNKKLAIKGHPTRGKEVIQLLEMLGADRLGYKDTFVGFYYYIECDAIVSSDECPIDVIVFTLEEFEKKFPYKVGDIVKCHAIWKGLIESMEWYEGEVVYSVRSYSDDYLTNVTAKHLQPFEESKCLQELKEYLDNTTPEQLEEDWKELKKFSKVGPVADEYVKQCKEDNKATGSRIDFSLTERIELDLGDTHEVVVENGKTYVVKKKPTYPKYYTECEASGLSLNPVNVALAQGVCMGAFAKLIVLRNAYWEIAGKQLGLDKPWKPKHEYDEEIFFIYCDRVNGINKGQGFPTDNFCLSFPTAEIRDTFYENFKEEIEMCKELL